MNSVSKKGLKFGYTTYCFVVINFIANPKNTKDASLFRNFWDFSDLLNTFDKEPERSAIEPNIKIVAIIKRAPKNSICKDTVPNAGFVNWGRKAKKKIETFGFVIFIIIPR